VTLALCAGSTPTVQQVLSYPFVTVFMHGPKARGALLGNGGAGAEDRLRKGFAPAIEVNSIDTAKQVARHSNALFPASRQMVAAELARGELVCLDYDVPGLRTRAALVRMRDRTPSPVALKFMELVRTVESALLASEETDTLAAL
jgi:DNA-binding transcriptional LysR family regulator